MFSKHPSCLLFFIERHCSVMNFGLQYLAALKLVPVYAFHPDGAILKDPTKVVRAVHLLAITCNVFIRSCLLVIGS